ncbi:MAG: SNF2 helicase associated domain-containing protein [Candidatus Gastranaerophilaceae bacterium]
MFTVDDISIRCVERNTFSRGELIYKVGNVKHFHTEPIKKEHRVKIRANIKGNNIENFDAEAVVDEITGSIEKVKCSCADGAKSEELCRHCVAMLLEYIRQRDGSNMVAVRAEGFHKRTDPEVLDILERFALEKRAGYIQPDLTGQVKIVPEIEIAVDKTLDVEFRVGIHNLYIVKSVVTFAEEFIKGAKTKFGKTLSYYNTISAYDKDSQNLMRFIAVSESENVKKHRNLQKRSILIRGNLMDAFFNAVGEGQVTVTRGMDTVRLNVREEKPNLLAMVFKTPDGIDVTMDRQRFLCGQNYIYFVGIECIYKVRRTECEHLEEWLEYSSIFGRTGVTIAEQDIPMFVREVLPELRKVCNVQVHSNFDEEQYLGKRVKIRIYLDSPEPDVITCKAFAYEDGSEEGVNIFDRYPPGSNADMQDAAVAATRLYHMFNAFDPEEKCPVLSDSNDKLYALLTEGIPIMQELGQVFISDEIRNIRVNAAPKIHLGISVKGDFLEMAVSGDEMSPEQIGEILARYDRRKKYYRLKNGDFIRLENSQISALTEMGQKLHLSKKEFLTGKVKIPKYRSMYVESGLNELYDLDTHYDDSFRRLVSRVKNAALESAAVPEEMKGVLRPYQEQGFVWMKILKECGFGAVLADEMGLGKTLQVITLLIDCKKNTKENEKKHPSLVICPASLVYNWKSEIERFAPDLNTLMITGNAQEREEKVRQAEEYDVLITSYDLLRRDVEFYEDQLFECEIIDEAQYIKNHNTQVARSVKIIQAGFRAALTGTPVENRLSELWSIFDYVMPGFLYPYNKFREEIESPIVIDNDEKQLQFLQKMIAPFILRRLKKDVLAFLPEKIEKNMFAKMDGEQWEIYQAHVQRIRMMLNEQSDSEFKKSKIQILSELTKLRQICCDPALLYEKYKEESAKTVMCMELIKNAIEGGHKVLVFSQFTSMLKNLTQHLEQDGIKYYILTGDTPKEHRTALVDMFNDKQNNDVNIFCISLKAGGTGLNLTAADIVIHFDPWWNVAVQNQATDRAHRIGQENVVTVYKLIAKDSIEEKIVELQDKKKELAEQIMESDSISSADFSKEQLLELL